MVDKLSDFRVPDERELKLGNGGKYVSWAAYRMKKTFVQNVPVSQCHHASQITYKWTVVRAMFFNFFTVLRPAETCYIAVEVKRIDFVLATDI